MNTILISLSSFGAAEVGRHGQLWFARLAQQAGADGFEVRGELMRDGEAELVAIAAALPDMERVYSSPDGLWDVDGHLDHTALERGLSAARALGSSRLKMSIGGYRADAVTSLPVLGQWIERAGIELVIENDQTESAGTLNALVRFFEAADARGLKLGMTFDIGNWHWVGECPLQAAATLASRVCYVHCKGVQRLPNRWVAVPLGESAAPWRAILRTQPANRSWAIEYPLVGDDLLAVTQREVAQLRSVAGSMA
ncbi:glutamine ABC transporter ATP-binding protein [Hydrogenophaga crassostreae]|uniref:Glutamine ABC transporter ATP-binding protein n=1 Tax=Hydrogenophaga crassostreae TaxID=1763535 RepID=A0A167GRA3_9BURK|nr:TIM barrel protein [Hydrogenophaga crassostreae]AOW11702.1 glutamine ABC transporter ATP-binding protein [Hydrogenophaga crassostreae]OAD39794.1 glutamine ABC transporter ATP-binding protein [Hydrogenophaga crassostreae]